MPFDAIRHISASGEFWSARELMPLLEYSSWQRFEEAIQRAMADCAKAGVTSQKTLPLMLEFLARGVLSRRIIDSHDMHAALSP
jgi:DNA-damage-inducible protein D